MLVCRSASNIVWLGLNFYGRAFAADGSAMEDIVGHQYQSIVGGQVHWHEDFQEHVTAYKEDGSQRLAWYPSTESIQVRDAFSPFNSLMYGEILECLVHSGFISMM